jgi:hypothetical protein
LIEWIARFLKSMGQWWSKSSGYAKAAIVLTAMLVLEIGLCAVAPSANATGSVVLLGLFLATALCLVIALVVWMFKA